MKVTKILLFWEYNSLLLNIPLVELQSQHLSLLGNLWTCLMMACCSSNRLGFAEPAPPAALPPSSKARNNAPSLQLTRTDIHARWSFSSSAWKWYVLLSVTGNTLLVVRIHYQYDESVLTLLFVSTIYLNIILTFITISLYTFVICVLTIMFNFNKIFVFNFLYNFLML